MKLEIQGENECFLGTIAMLKNLSIKEVREKALELVSGKDWMITESRTTEDFETVRKFFNLPALYIGVTPTSTIETLDLSGKGSVYVGWIEGRAHIMAFEKGFIYDPNGWIETWEEWKEKSFARYGLTIESVIVTKI